MPKAIQIFNTLAELTQNAAQQFIQIGLQVLVQKDRFSVALSGGNTPRALYALLAQPDYRSKLDWSRVDFFWGDERCVPPNHPDSDYGMAYDSLLAHLHDFNPGIYRLEGEIAPLEAADHYERMLKNYFGDSPQFSFDLLLLGMGDDAHTASLFPGTPAIHEQKRWAVAHFVPRLNTWRLTLTPPLFNRSKNTIFLASGRNKAAALRAVLTGEPQTNLYPAQIIQPMNGNLTWLVDREAASEMPPAR